MTPREIVSALRKITSAEFRRRHHFPVTVIAQLAGLTRETIYQARAGNGLTSRVVNVLTPVLTDILEGRLEAYIEPDKWRVRRTGEEERRFFGVRPMGRKHRLRRDAGYTVTDQSGSERGE